MEPIGLANGNLSGEFANSDRELEGSKTGSPVQCGRAHSYREQLQIHAADDRADALRLRIQAREKLVRPAQVVWTASGPSIAASARRCLQPQNQRQCRRALPS